MMPIIITISSSIFSAIILVLPAAATAAAPHLKMFSMYDDDPSGQQGIVNVRLNVLPYSGSSASPGGITFNFSSIDHGYSAYNMSSFVDLAANGFVWVGRTGLAAGWQRNIAATVQAARSRLVSGAVAGLFLGDEVVCGGVHVENLTAVAAYSKQQLLVAGVGHGLVYVNECKLSFNNTHRPYGIKGLLPAGLDLISFDAYQLSNLSTFAPTPWWLQEPRANRAFVARELIPRMHPHQRLMVIPGLYGNDSATAAEHAVQDTRLVAKLEAYWEWIKGDDRIIGLNPYHWVCHAWCRLFGFWCPCFDPTVSWQGKPNASCQCNGPVPPPKCRHMCYGSVCGRACNLFGFGARNFPRLLRRMRQIGAIIRSTTKTDDDSLLHQKAAPSRPSVSSLVTIHTESAMRHANGTAIDDCNEPHIFKFMEGGQPTFFAYGFSIQKSASCNLHWDPTLCMPATCYSSTNLASWRRRSPCFPSGGLGAGRIRHVLHNNRTSEFVGFSQVYGVSFSVFTSPTPVGPFSFRNNISAGIFGGPADASIYNDDSGSAFLVYNAREQHNRSVRFTFVYRLTDDYYDIVPSSRCNTSTSMEGLWMFKRHGIYFLLGSRLDGYNVNDNFYLTAPSPLGPWKRGGYIAPSGSDTFDSQTFRGLEVEGPKGSAFVYIGFRWCGAQEGKKICRPPFVNASSIWLPLRFDDNAGTSKIQRMQWYDSWVLDTEGAIPHPCRN